MCKLLESIPILFGVHCLSFLQGVSTTPLIDKEEDEEEDEMKSTPVQSRSPIYLMLDHYFSVRNSTSLDHVINFLLFRNVVLNS